MHKHSGYKHILFYNKLNYIYLHLTVSHVFYLVTTSRTASFAPGNKNKQYKL